MTKTLDGYPWSSHPGYLSRSSKWKWLYKDGVWEMLATKPAARIDGYRKFVAREDSRELRQLFSWKRWPVFLGPEEFMARVRGRFYSKKTDFEVPQRKELTPAWDRLVEVVSRGYRVKREDLFYIRRGHGNEARNVAIYLARRLRGERLEIGEAFKIDRYSTVSSIVERMKVRKGSDETLRKRVDHLMLTIQRNQQQT